MKSQPSNENAASGIAASIHLYPNLKLQDHYTCEMYHTARRERRNFFFLTIPNVSALYMSLIAL